MVSRFMVFKTVSKLSLDITNNNTNKKTTRKQQATTSYVYLWQMKHTMFPKPEATYTYVKLWQTKLNMFKLEAKCSYDKTSL
jgi:hypothetical protein